MCGRYTLHSSRARLLEKFGLDRADEVEPRYNIAPSQEVPVVRQQGDARELVHLRWGLLPFWADDPRIGYKMINARAETVASKPAFRPAFRRRRCLVPADGFYEWKAQGRAKQPYYLRMQDGEVFAFAGLWEHWQGEGEVVESFTIIVGPPNELGAPIHDRMPVILDPASYDRWLEPQADPAALAALLGPYPADAMEAYPVSRRVNRPANDDEQCIAPA